MAAPTRKTSWIAFASWGSKALNLGADNPDLSQITRTPLAG
jgi:hypothetical protein